MSDPKLPPTFLSTKNAHERDKLIEFDEPTHKYTINGEEGYVSVTTFLHGHFDHFDSDKIIAGILKNKRQSDPTYKYFGKTKEDILAEWNANCAFASTAGTNMHYDIECFYNGLEPDNTSIEYEYFKRFAADHENLVPFRTEWCVFNEEIKLAGSIDMVFQDKYTKEFHIYDWKRVKEISYDSTFNKFAKTKCISHLPDTNFWHYSLQLNTYKAILEAKYGMKIVDLYLIACHPDNPSKTYEKIECMDLTKEVGDLFEERRLMLNS
jgi:hypothetical protein